jgi:hypothetical protein
MGFVVGIVLAFVVFGFARWTGFDRDRAFYPTTLIVVASYYVLFGAMGGSSHALVVELAVMAVFVLLAVVGFKRSSWLVVAGMAAHGLFDVLHPQLVHNAGVPQWWPAFCAAFDVGFAGLLAVPLSRVLSRIRHARST